MKRNDYLLAIFLIFLGSVLLLNTTGIIEWDVWSVLWKFWPLLIVFAGLSLIFEDSKILSVILGVLALVSLAFIFLWSASVLQTPSWFNTVVQEQKEVEKFYIVSLEDFPNIQKKEFEIDMNVGSLSIVNEGLSDHMALGAKYHDGWNKPSLEKKEVNGVLETSLELGKKDFAFFFGSSFTPRYYLNLGSDDITTDLSLNLGAGQSEIFLNDYELRNLNIEVGAGNTKTKLVNMNINELNAEVGAGNLSFEISKGIQIREKINVEVGVGQLTLDLPENAQYKIDAEIGVGSIKTPDGEVSGFGKDTVKLQSDDYDDAEVKFIIIGEVGVGQLIIK